MRVSDIETSHDFGPDQYIALSPFTSLPFPYITLSSYPNRSPPRGFPIPPLPSLLSPPPPTSISQIPPYHLPLPPNGLLLSQLPSLLLASLSRHCSNPMTRVHNKSTRAWSARRVWRDEEVVEEEEEEECERWRIGVWLGWRGRGLCVVCGI